MKALSALVAIAGAVVIGNTGAFAQTVGDRRAGLAFAREVCTPCHIVAPDQLSPPRFASAPDFHGIANAPGMTELSLHAFLSSPHPSMPNLSLSQKKQDDVIAYILSLRDRK